MSVGVRFLSGERNGGVVWRYRDPSNYYYADLSLGQQSISLNRVVDGNRVRLEMEDDLELDPVAWYTIQVVQLERSVRVCLGGIRVFEERDRAPVISGAVGVWCGGASVAQCHALRVQPARE